MNLAEGFISRQQLGINGTSDAAMLDDNVLLKGAVATTDGEKHAAHSQVLTPGSLHASASQIGDCTVTPEATQLRPLCSQEDKIQHVSSC